MGAYGSRHSHGWHLQRLGVLQASNVQTVSASGTYSMTSALDPTTAADDAAHPAHVAIPRQRARLVLPGGPRARAASFDDFSLADPVLGGVSIRVNDDPAWTHALAAARHPPRRGRHRATRPLRARRDLQRRPGERDDDLGRRRVGHASQVDARRRGRLDTAGADRAPGLSATPSPPGRVRLAWNGSGDNIGVDRYTVFRDGVQIGSTARTTSRTRRAAPGRTSTPSSPRTRRATAALPRRRYTVTGAGLRAAGSAGCARDARPVPPHAAPRDAPATRSRARAGSVSGCCSRAEAHAGQRRASRGSSPRIDACVSCAAHGAGTARARRLAPIGRGCPP